MTTIGQELAEERRRRKASVKDVEKAIKIRTKYISAMERDEFKVIEGEAYVLGFLKTYAQWLEIDPQPLLERYRDQAETSNPDKIDVFSSRDLEVKIRRRRFLLGFVFLVAFVILLITLATQFLPLLVRG